MRDPHEGIGPDGTIVTGAAVERVSEEFVPLLADATSAVTRVAPNASLYVYGSVATGQARPGASDLDLLTIGLAHADARTLGLDLSERHAELVRAVEFAPMQPDDLVGEGDERYGNRVFARHYGAHVAGPDVTAGWPPFPADVRAARGFNGDIGAHAERWRSLLAESLDGDDIVALGRRVARKSMLAVTGLVSVHDRVWTTDRETAARRWAEVKPALAGELARLSLLAEGEVVATGDEIGQLLDGVVSRIVEAFAESIGLWSE